MWFIFKYVIILMAWIILTSLFYFIGGSQLPYFLGVNNPFIIQGVIDLLPLKKYYWVQGYTAFVALAPQIVQQY